MRETLHIMDDKQRIALVETRNAGDDGSTQQLIRYQFGNHLGSASLELDDQAQIISYEEYTPYGSTSYQAVRQQTEVNPKRYRYTGKERDEESGLYYHGARYYAPWLGRWTQADPAGTVDGTNLYAYASASPIRLVDPNGMQNKPNSDADRRIMMMKDPQLIAQLRSLSPTQRGDFLSRATGAFRNRAEAARAAARLKVEYTLPAQTISVEPPVETIGAEIFPPLRTRWTFNVETGERIAPDAPFCPTSACHQPALLTGGDARWVPELYIAGGVRQILGTGEASAPRSAEEAAAGPKSPSELEKTWESAKFFALWKLPILGRGVGQSAALESAAELEALEGELATSVSRERFLWVMHQRTLGLDPAHGGEYSATEARVGGELQQYLRRRLIRSPHEGEDWVEHLARTKSYDLVGPVPTEEFNAASFTEQITSHLGKVEHPVVDLRGLTASQISKVDTFISGLSTSERSRLIIFR